MKVTKKQQWAPITIELESADELRCLGDILSYAITRAERTTVAGVATYSFAHALNNKLYEASK